MYKPLGFAQRYSFLVSPLSPFNYCLTSVMDSDSDESVINDEYEYWENSSPFVYDLLITHTVEWPSLTVEWLPYRVQTLDGYTAQKVILGTYTADGEPNYLIIAQVKLPLWDECANDEEYGVGCNIEILRRIPHDGEVHRARHMPQDPFVIATKTISSEVHIFDYKNHPAEPPTGGTSKPDLRLTGHHEEGYGLSWNTINRGFLLSGSNDAKICLWDIDQAPLNKAVIDALQTFEVHEGTVEDVAWHLKHCHIFGSCGEDRYLRLYDLRSPCFTSPAQSLIAHERAINCLSFNPFNEYAVATGADDNTVKCFDLRKLVRPVHTFEHHIHPVVKIEWSPHSENILASCCDGRKVMIWDTHRIGREQSEADLGRGPPELVFSHDKHTDRVADFSWNPTEDGMIASVSDDNILQVWKMADHIYSDY